MEHTGMGKARLEAFSDGVIAIIVTIMILELRTPTEPTVTALIKLAPQLSELSFELSVGRHHVGESSPLYACDPRSQCAAAVAQYESALLDVAGSLRYGFHGKESQPAAPGCAVRIGFGLLFGGFFVIAGRIGSAISS